MADYQGTKWWRAVGPDGRVWCESSSEQEVRDRLRDGDELQRLYQKVEYDWRVERDVQD